jgi:hypothetical protein
MVAFNWSDNRCNRAVVRERERAVVLLLTSPQVDLVPGQRFPRQFSGSDRQQATAKMDNADWCMADRGMSTCPALQ